MSSAFGPMACPNDGATLVMSERSGIEIDYCPTCRGVWLDRGELDKIIERNAAAAPIPSQAPQHYAPASPWGNARDRESRDHRHGPDHDYRSRKKSFLSDLFD